MYHVSNAPIIKRFAAFAMDLFIFILTLSMFYSIFGNVFASTKNYKIASEGIDIIKLNSKLYVENENKEIVVIIADEFKLKDSEKILKIQESLDYFYYDFLKTEYQDEDLKDEYLNYENEKKNSKCFELVNGKYELKEEAKSDDILAFYQSELSVAINMLKDSKQYHEYDSYLGRLVLYNGLFSFILSFLIFFLIIPLFMPKRATLGQKLMNLGVLDRNNNVATRTQIAFRVLIIAIVEVYLSLIAFYIPIVVSIAFVIFRKDHKSYHDLLADVRVVDFIYSKEKEILEKKGYSKSVY